MGWQKKNYVHNQHIATCSDTKVHQASLNSFWVILGSICFCNILTISIIKREWQSLVGHSPFSGQLKYISTSKFMYIESLYGPAHVILVHIQSGAAKTQMSMNICIVLPGPSLLLYKKNGWRWRLKFRSFSLLDTSSWPLKWGFYAYSKTCLKRTLKLNIEKLVFNTDYCLMQVKSIAECSKGEHSAILSTFIKLPFSIKTFVMSLFKWPLKTGFTVPDKYQHLICWPICVGIHISTICWFLPFSWQPYNSLLACIQAGTQISSWSYLHHLVIYNIQKGNVIL